MRVINVVRFDNGALNGIESFGIFEEQLSQDVVDAAETDFVTKAKAIGFVPECLNEGEDDLVTEILDDGYYDSPDGFHSVYISWSEI